MVMDGFFTVMELPFQTNKTKGGNGAALVYLHK
jgi:hypothetical protein